MNKEQIISEFNSKEKKLKEQYPSTDGAKYLRTIPIDPYGGKIDMPKEKFPEYHNWHEKKDGLNKEYHRIISRLAKYKNGDIVVVGCEDSIKFGKIKDGDFFINGGSDILYQIKFDESFNVWKYGSSGGYFGENSCSCTFYEKDVLMKVSFEEMKEMNKIPINGLKIMYPELFVPREYDEKLDKIKNLVCGFVNEVTK